MSPATDPTLHSNDSCGLRSFASPRFLLLALALTLVATAGDQFATPILYSSSPLWGTAACLLLVWRRGNVPSSVGDTPFECNLSAARVVGFLALHAAIIVVARSVSGMFQASSGAMTLEGTLVAAGKLCVLAPTIILFPLATWKKIACIYFPEAIAGLVVLFTFFPRRVLQAGWPWYGQVLGRFVHILARIFVSKLTYLADSNPTLSGPELNVTIIPDCSGLNGVELFDYLFGAVAFLDWNRFRKGRALLVYFAGLLAMLLGNAIRITSFVALGNHGFAESVSRFHISAGWIFFSAVFLVYLSMTYRWMLDKRIIAEEPRQPS